MRAALAAHLAANSTLSSLVSTRVYSRRLPENAWISSLIPAVVLNRLDTVPVKHISAASTLTESLWQIDAYASTSVSNDAVSDAIRNCLDGHRGLIGTVASGRVWTQRCHLTSTTDEDMPPQSGQGVARYRTVMTFEIDHAVAVPTFS